MFCVLCLSIDCPYDVCAMCVLFVMFSVYIVCSISSDLVCEDPRHHTHSYSPESVARMEFHTLLKIQSTN